MQNPLDYTTFDLDGTQSIAAKIYNITSGSAVIDSTVSLAHVINGSYFGNFQSDDAKDYLVNIMVYTDGGYGTASANYSPSSRIIKARSVLFKKNTAYPAFTFPLYDSDGALITGQTVTATRSIDGGGFTACTNAVAELSSGMYSLDLSAADLNGSEIVLKFAASGARTQIVSIFTAL